MEADELSKINLPNFIWQPGIGPCSLALKRMGKRFPKPSEPLGEAWFLSKDRKIYTEFTEQPLSSIPTDLINEALYQIAGEITCFKDIGPWHDWLYYILPMAVERADGFHGYSLFESLISANLLAWASRKRPPYKEFRSDLLLTVGQSLMKPSLWYNSLDLHPDIIEIESVYWKHGPHCFSLLSASLFFCLVFLSERYIDAWVDSLFRIKGAFWRINLFVWLVYADQLFTMGEPYLPHLTNSGKEIRWIGCHLLTVDDAPEISKSKFEIFFRSVRRRIHRDDLRQLGTDSSLGAIAHYFRQSSLEDRIVELIAKQ